MALATTRDLIVQRADALFYETGYEATSFADIAGAVGISRGNFYHHFKSKDEILAAVLALRRDRTRDMLLAWEATAETPMQRLTCFARMLIANRSKIMAHGCPVGSLCTELAKLDHAAQPEAAAIMAMFRDWIAGQFLLMGAGDQAKALALELLGWSQGAAVLAATFRDEAWLDAEVARIESRLASLPHHGLTP